MADDQYTTKLCSTCKQALLLAAFSKSKDKRDGLASSCRRCLSERNRARYADDPEKHCAVRRAWVEANPEKSREGCRAYYQANKDKVRAANRAWSLKNVDKVREYLRSWKSSNRDRVRELGRSWMAADRAANPEKHRAYRHNQYHSDIEKFRERARVYASSHRKETRAYARAWRAANPERVRLQGNARRARKAGAPGRGWTVADVAEVKVAQRDRCAFCRIKLGNDFHRDHITPLSKGGAHDRRNLQLLCQSCNLSKNASDPLDYARRRGLLL